ncbi:hypothetical protein [Methylocystis sp. SC2]|uniref:hypothetical protein n=1 Tax=Methylocystis sp. (strain SC2) TaxID=187303 RepID=UPI00027AEA6A|nr:hypothetical protein [Methylocystis sp. SC2]CCJ05628.1 Hypothetical protein BN69_0177 [Methylocystis sp. SC2]
MAGFIHVEQPQAFGAQPGVIVDWSIGADGAPVGVQPVDRQDIYAVNGGGLVINPNGPTANRRACDGNDMRVNLREGDALIVAEDPSAAATLHNTPITLTFANPVRGVGAFVAVDGQDVQPGLPLLAVMWLRQLDGNWTHVVASGVTGANPIAQGQPDSAAFVGALASGNERIAEVRFDATFMGNRPFKFLALSPLYGAL